MGDVTRSPTTEAAATSAPTSTAAASSSGSAATLPPSTTVPVFTEDQLKAALLTVDDLPTGWAGQAPSNPNGEGFCGQGTIDSQVKPAAKSTTQFVKGKNVPQLYEELLSYPDDGASKAFDFADEQAQSCATFTLGGVDAEIAQLSVPPLGDTTSAYRLTLSNAGVTAIVDLTFVRKGCVIIYMAYADLSPDTNALVSFTKQAYDKAAATLGLT